MKTEKGSTRIVLIIGPIAIKVPYIFVRGKVGQTVFWRGVVSNVSECATSALGHKDDMVFLAQTYFTLGVINFQKAIHGNHPTDQEVRERIATLSADARRDAARVDSHHLQSTNFIVQNGRWFVVDYGNHLNGYGVSFSRFLTDHADELSVAFGWA